MIGREGSLTGPRSPERAGWVALDRGHFEGVGGAGGVAPDRVRSRIMEDTSSGSSPHGHALPFISLGFCMCVCGASLHK